MKQFLNLVECSLSVVAPLSGRREVISSLFKLPLVRRQFLLQALLISVFANYTKVDALYLRQDTALTILYPSDLRIFHLNFLLEHLLPRQERRLPAVCFHWFGSNLGRDSTVRN